MDRAVKAALLVRKQKSCFVIWWRLMKMSFEVRLALAPPGWQKENKKPNEFPDLVPIHTLHSQAWLYFRNTDNLCINLFLSFWECRLHICSWLSYALLSVLIHWLKAWCSNWSVPLSRERPARFSCHVQLMPLSCCDVGDIVLLAIACWAIDGFSLSAMAAMLQPMMGCRCCTVRNWMAPPEWALTLAACDCTALPWQCGNWGFCKRHILGLLRSCRSWNRSAQISVQVTVFFFLNTSPGSMDTTFVPSADILFWCLDSSIVFISCLEPPQQIFAALCLNRVDMVTRRL